MLKSLHIKNLVLIESCSIEFAKGMAVLTGESGAGKTAILHGLKLVLGQKLDTSLIRLGAKKGSVQAEFLFPPLSLMPLLTEIGLEWEESSLFLFREVSHDGKSKCFINDRAVSLSFLQKISSHLIQIVDQSSYQELRQSEVQRELLDLFGSLSQEVSSFSKAFEELKEKRIEEKKLEELARQKERELAFCLSQEKELKDFFVQEEEENLLFQEYSLASRAQEVVAKTDQLFDLISNGPNSLLNHLSQARHLCRSLSKVNDLFLEPETLLNQSSLNIEEVLHLLQRALSIFDTDPKRLQYLEDRLHFIDRMKKKYGSSQEEVKAYKTQLENKIELFSDLDEVKHTLETRIQDLENKIALLAQSLTEKRKDTAATLTTALEKELSDLNMQQARVGIHIEPHPRSSFGEDKVIFALAANLGETTSYVKDSTSGGELSRFLLAFKICLAEKNHTSILVFDEIDANVGGETARMIGEKLLALSSHKQILCITHFPQVACQAHLHLRVQKQSDRDRTFATVLPLNAELKEKELLRMLGGAKLLPNT